MKKLDKYLEAFETGAFVVLLSVMTVVVFLQVIFRYVLRSSLPWSEELARYCMVYMVFIGVSAGLKAGSHTGVDAFVALAAEPLKHMLILIEKVICLILSASFFVVSAQMTAFIFSTGQLSSTLHIPIAFAYLALPVGFLGGIIRSVQNVIKCIKREED